MSRIGKKPIQLTDNTTITVNSGLVIVKGPKGELTHNFGDKINIVIKDKEVFVEKRDDSMMQDSLQGTTRALIANMVNGVANGYKKSLELTGVGFRVNKKGNDLEFNIGFSHPVLFKTPEGISLDLEKNTIHVSGIDKQLVGETAANIRKLKEPEPYKGKGIRYTDEVVRRKAGKAGKAGK
jgi:large subunit ribosomal protein L6